MGKEYIKAMFRHLAYLTTMLSTSYEILGWMTQTGIKDCQEKYQQPQTCRLYSSTDRKQRGTKEPLDEGEKGE